MPLSQRQPPPHGSAREATAPPSALGAKDLWQAAARLKPVNGPMDLRQAAARLKPVPKRETAASKAKRRVRSSGKSSTLPATVVSADATKCRARGCECVLSGSSGCGCVTLLLAVLATGARGPDGATQA